MKRYVKMGIPFLCLLWLVGEIFTGQKQVPVLNTEEGISQIARTREDDLEIYTEDGWEKLFLKGVNLGTAKPGYYPGEFGITKKEYLRWFRQIQEMNANVIRVYTLQMPVFYEALVERFKQEIASIIDVLHGNAEIDKKRGRGYGSYLDDVSPYVVGYILGIEWDPYFVETTNQLHAGTEDFFGEYIYTKDARPTELFFAKMLEHTIAYETKTYEMQKPAAIS